MQTSARRVLDQVAQDLKSRGLTHEDIARDLGYKTRQSVGAILAANKYMTAAQAKRFSETYGYYENFLTSGEGTLEGPSEDPGTTYFVPQYALLLRPFDSLEKFQEAYEVFLRGLVASYGAQNIQHFLNDTIKYITLLDKSLEEWIQTQPVVDTGGNCHNPNDLDPNYARNLMKDFRSFTTSDLYETYNKMIRK